MMGRSYRCDRCLSAQWVTDSPLAYYTLPDGRSFFGTHGTGWCRRCRLLGSVESIPTPESVVKRVAALDQFPDNDHIRAMRDHYAMMLDWARIRREPPRCLACGGRDFIPLKEGEDALGDCLAESVADGLRPFFHPGCGGIFRLEYVDFDQPAGLSLDASGELNEGRWEGAVGRAIRRLIFGIEAWRDRRALRRCHDGFWLSIPGAPEARNRSSTAARRP